MVNIQSKNTANGTQSIQDTEAKYIIASGIQKLIADNLKLIKYCNLEEKEYLIAQNIAYQKTLNLIRNYILDKFNIEFMTS